MIGRAGRPGFDTHADAVVMVRAEMKEYYKRVSVETIAALLDVPFLELICTKFAAILHL